MRLAHIVEPLVNRRPIPGQLGSGGKPLEKLDPAYLAFQANILQGKKINLTQSDSKEIANPFILCKMLKTTHHPKYW